MTDANTIASEIGESDVIANHESRTYRVVGVTDIQSLPTVDGFSPVPDE